MARQGSGLAESIIFGIGIAALIYVSGIYSSDKPTSKSDKDSAEEFVLDNGQHCHMDKNSTVFCTDAKGVYQPVTLSSSDNKKPPPKP